MIVYGRNPVREALRGRRRVQRVFATERAAREVWLGEVEVRVVEPPEITERCGSPDHQGICAEAQAYPYADADALLEPDEALVLCLDEIQDPQNLGAICRVAEVAGCAGVVLPERRAAEVTPAVCRASAGAVEHLDYGGRVVLVLGSEGRGLRPRVSAHCDELVALPTRGRIGSLNVSTAAAALVYGILHFRSALDRAP